MISPSNPLGKILGSSVSYDMETSMIQLPLNSKFILSCNKLQQKGLLKFSNPFFVNKY